jgi:hypothetical protein
MLAQDAAERRLDPVPLRGLITVTVSALEFSVHQYR